MAALSRPDDIPKATDVGGGSDSAYSSGKEASPMMCYALRLRPGEELKGALAEFASNRGIRVRETWSNREVFLDKKYL